MLLKNFARSIHVGPAGYTGLIQELGLQVPAPTVCSEIVASTRRTIISEAGVVEQYPRSYEPEGVIAHLEFALRYEPCDLGVLKAAFRAMGAKTLETWIRQKPTGIFTRRAWYLYELLTRETLDLPDVPATATVDVLDPRLHITAEPVRVRRQRVNDNLLGTGDYCPLIRRTPLLESKMESGLRDEARTLIEGCDPAVLTRAVSYLYTKETKSSYAIEGESPSNDRSERFVAALSRAEDFDPLAEPSFVQLQNTIVDPRYRESSWRTIQNFVGQTRSDYTEHVHYVCPKPDDVGVLMRAWMQSVERLRTAAVDPVCAAAAASFGFVFIHPFEDGNGRIHRFLIHHILAKARFTPPEVLLPVSAVIVRERRAYDQVLGAYSDRIEPFIRWAFDVSGRMRVGNDTADLYRYWDATPYAEYLYAQVTEAIRRDLREEIAFLRMFDKAVARIVAIVDMPDRRASLLGRLIIQNKGQLAKGKRGLFSELTQAELAAIESAVQETMES